MCKIITKKSCEILYNITILGSRHKHCASCLCITMKANMVFVILKLQQYYKEKTIWPTFPLYYYRLQVANFQHYHFAYRYYFYYENDDKDLVKRNNSAPNMIKIILLQSTKSIMFSLILYF